MDSSAVPKVSVIIPLYNKAPYIKRALDSVFAQTVQDFEVIVVNDGSKDGGEKIVEEYGDSRIHLINQENQGVSAARNHGVDAAQAELVAFLDADDEWLPEFLETIFRLREKWPDAGMYTTNWIRVSPEGKEIIQRSQITPPNWEGIVPSPFKCAAIDGVFPGCSSSIAIPKNVISTIGGFNEKYHMGEDIEMWARIALDYTNAHSSVPHAKYMSDDENSAMNANVYKIHDRYPFQITVDEYESSGKITRVPLGDKDLCLYLSRLKISVIQTLIAEGHCKEARKELKHIKERDLKKIKYITYIRSLIPNALLPMVRKIWKTIQTR